MFGLIGLGQMGPALAHGLVAAKLVKAEEIVAFDVSAEAREKFQAALPAACVVEDAAEVVDRSATTVLAVKPHIVESACQAMAKAMTPDKLVVSVCAGIKLAALEEWLETGRVVRVMPNTPCLVGDGAAAFALGTEAKDEDQQHVKKLLSSVGIAFCVEEGLLDAVTGLSGSGPAYIFLAIEALADGGVRMGLPRPIAQALAAHTVRGAANMVCQGIAHPAELKDRVASPGGTTIAGLQALESHAVRAGMMAAVEAATRRAQEL